MRVAIVSDIHVDINRDYNVFDALIRIMQEKEAQAILIAGDITSDPDQTLEWIHRFADASKKEVYFVPGNHDLWNEKKLYRNTDEIYQMLAGDEHCICDKTVMLGNCALIGDVCWFDYSFGNHEKFTTQDFETMSRNGRTWQDSLFNDWTKHNMQTSDAFLQKLEKRIVDCRKENPDREILLMTHMIANKMYKVPENIADWSFFNAFLGTEKLERLCVEQQITYSVCGHVHYRHSEKKDGVVWMCRCLNYHTEWQENKDVYKQLQDAMEILDL